jgi:hypothetical protein
MVANAPVAGVILKSDIVFPERVGPCPRRQQRDKAVHVFSDEAVSLAADVYYYSAAPQQHFPGPRCGT